MRDTYLHGRLLALPTRDGNILKSYSSTHMQKSYVHLCLPARMLAQKHTHAPPK